MCIRISEVSWIFEHIHHKNTYISPFIRANLTGNKSIRRVTHSTLSPYQWSRNVRYVDSWKTNSKTTKTASKLNKKLQLHNGQLPTATGRAQKTYNCVCVGTTGEGLVVQWVAGIKQWNTMVKISKTREPASASLTHHSSSQTPLHTSPSHRKVCVLLPDSKTR